MNRWVYFWKYLTAVRDLATKIWKSYEQGGSMHNKFKAVLTARKNARRRAAELPTPMDLGPNLDDHLERQRRRGSEDGSAEEGTGFRRPGITDILLAEHEPVPTPVTPDTRHRVLRHRPSGDPLVPVGARNQAGFPGSRLYEDTPEGDFVAGLDGTRWGEENP